MSDDTAAIGSKVKWVKKFIEYARYELQPGEMQFGDQFPRQSEADKAMRELDDVLAHLEAPAVAPPAIVDAAEMLWVVLANVSGGDWTQQSAEWQEAAARWRDNYFAALKASSGPSSPRSPLCYVPSCANPAAYHDEYGVPHCETHRHQSDPPASGSRVAPPGETPK